MKIYLNLLNTYKNNRNFRPVEDRQSQKQASKSIEYMDYPFWGKNFYLSFKGKNHFDLNETMQDLYNSKRNELKKVVPDRVKEAADYVLEAGNPKKLALIDVHRHVYEPITFADSLDEVKEMYPEFNSVKSAYEINVRDDSFIADVLAGKCEVFSPDEDLSLQLLKLYWGNGYSLEDLEKYSNGNKNLAYAMRKLGIPCVDQYYGQRLKYSDSQYMSRLIETIKLKQIERYQKNALNGVYIPRGPMSEEQKMKISESLIEYYSKNPETIYAPTKRQQEFYKKNSAASKLFTEVLFDAWRLGSSKPVKLALHNFFKSKNTQLVSERELSNVNKLGAKNRLLMLEFWEKNPDARKQFSRSMQSAWKRVKKIKAASQEVLVYENSLPAFPKKIAEAMKEWVAKNGYDPSCITLTLANVSNDFNQNILNKSMGAKLVTEYFDKNPLMADIYADSFAYALAELRMYLGSHRTASGDMAIRKIDAARNKTFLTVNEFVCLYLDVIQFLIKSDNVDGVVKLVNTFENCYDDVLKRRKECNLQVPN